MHKNEKILNMEAVNEAKTRMPRRSKADIDEAIHKAAVAQIKKKGFSLALVTDIVKRAKIEPIVFYNRYKNLDEFYDEFVKNYDYWLADLTRDSIDSSGSEEGYCNLLEKLMSNLLNDEIMTELLRWEVAEGNHITERTARLREMHAFDLTNTYKSAFNHDNLDVVAITGLLVAGIYYMILHKDRSTLGGIDINMPEGRRRVVQALRSISALMFHHDENVLLSSEESDDVEKYRRNFESTCRERVAADFRTHVEDLIAARREADRYRIATQLRHEGVPEDVIARCMAEPAQN